MSTVIPPGWTCLDCTWNTDVEHGADSAETLGGTYIHFKTTTPANDPYIVSDLRPVRAEYYCGCYCMAKASSASAGRLVYLKAAWYDYSKAYISTTSIYSDEMLFSGEFLKIGGIVQPPSTACYVSIQLGKTNDYAFDVYFNEVEWKKIPVAFHAYSDGTVTINALATSKIACLGNVRYSYGGAGSVGYSSTADRFYAPHSGLYHFYGQVKLAGLDSGKTAVANLYVDGAGAISGPNCYSGGSGDVVAGVSADLYLAQYSYVELYCFNVDDDNRTTVNDGTVTFFCGHEISGVDY